MLQKIMVPLDGSQLGETALPYAVQAAGAVHANIDLLTVCQTREKEHERMCTLYLQKMAEEVTITLHKLKSKVKVSIAVVKGQPAEAIIKYANNQKIGLTVLVSHGRSGIMPWSAGSTATKIIQKSNIPVLLIRAGEPVTTGNIFSSILLPLDGSRYGEAAIPLVISLAAAFRSKVKLLRVLELEERVRTVGGIDHFVYSDEQTKQMDAEAENYLREIVHQFSEARIDAKSMCVTGEPAMEILKSSEGDDVSLVAMSSHGKSGITKWVLGSVSNKIVQAGKKPLLLVRPLYKNVT